MRRFALFAIGLSLTIYGSWLFINIEHINSFNIDWDAVHLNRWKFVGFYALSIIGCNLMIYSSKYMKTRN